MNSEGKIPQSESPGSRGESSPRGNPLHAGLRRRNPIHAGIIVLSAGTCLMAVMAILAPALVRAHLAATRNQTPPSRQEVLASNSTSDLKSPEAKPKTNSIPVVAVASRKTDVRVNTSPKTDSIVELVAPQGLGESDEPQITDENLTFEARLTDLKRRVGQIAASESARQKNAVEQSTQSLHELQQILHDAEDVLDAMAAPTK